MRRQATRSCTERPEGSRRKRAWRRRSPPKAARSGLEPEGRSPSSSRHQARSPDAHATETDARMCVPPPPRIAGRPCSMHRLQPPGGHLAPPDLVRDLPRRRRPPADCPEIGPSPSSPSPARSGKSVSSRHQAHQAGQQARHHQAATRRPFSATRRTRRRLGATRPTRPQPLSNT